LFLSTKQKQVLEAQGRKAENKRVADNHDRLNMPRSTMHSINSNIFNNFREALDVMDEYFDVFEGRYRRHGDPVWERMRSIRYKMKQAGIK